MFSSKNDINNELTLHSKKIFGFELDLELKLLHIKEHDVHLNAVKKSKILKESTYHCGEFSKSSMKMELTSMASTKPRTKHVMTQHTTAILQAVTNGPA